MASFLTTVTKIFIAVLFVNYWSEASNFVEYLNHGERKDGDELALKIGVGAKSFDYKNIENLNAKFCRRIPKKYESLTFANISQIYPEQPIKYASIHVHNSSSLCFELERVNFAKVIFEVYAMPYNKSTNNN